LDFAFPIPCTERRRENDRNKMSTPTPSTGATSAPTLYVCRLSGVVPVDPVVSPQGLLFERRLINQQLAIAGNVCPITKQPLTPDQLIPIRSGVSADELVTGAASELVKPRPPHATSIPALLHLMQSEWESCMLETFNLKQQLETVKQDLAHALYKEDAANRVIARLIKERDEARRALQQTEQNIGAAMRHAGGGGTAMDIDEGKKAPAPAPAAAAPGHLPAKIDQLLVDTSKSLSSTRKTRVKEAQSSVASIDDVRGFKVEGRSHPLHATTNPGILTLDIHKTNQDLLLTGGNDGQALVFNKATGKIASHLKGHKSAVTGVKFHPTSQDILFTCSLDFTANIWSNDGTGKYNVRHHLTGAQDALTGLSVHPSGDLLVTGGKDKSWAVYDVREGVELNSMNAGSALSTIDFHPDGVILAGGGASDGVVRIFDLKAWKHAATLKDAHVGGITAFAFSENGYHCASGDSSGVIKLWDLRKLANFNTLQCRANEGDKAGSIISSIRFDDTASYLAASVGSHLSIYACKQWEEIHTLNDHKDRITDIAWGSQARTIATVSMDRNLKIYA